MAMYVQYFGETLYIFHQRFHGTLFRYPLALFSTQELSYCSQANALFMNVRYNILLCLKVEKKLTDIQLDQEDDFVLGRKRFFFRRKKVLCRVIFVNHLYPFNTISTTACHQKLQALFCSKTGLLLTTFLFKCVTCCV